MPTLALIVPCRNEASRLHPDAWQAFLDANPDTTVHFVDDASTDGTVTILEHIHPRASVVRLDRWCGKAEAVRQGVLAAVPSGCAMVGYWDADLATPLTAVAALRAALQGEVQFVLGARVRMLGFRIERRPLRHYLGRVAATGASLLLGLPVYDTQCGAKILRTDLAILLFERPFVTRWMLDVELLARLRRLRRDWDAAAVEERVHEVPLRTWRDVPGGALTAGDVLAVPWQLARIWWTYR